MFFEDPSPSYFAPASFRSLNAAGALIKTDFDVEFKRFTKSALAALDARIRADKLSDEQVILDVATSFRVKVAGDVKSFPVTVEALASAEEKHPGFAATCARSFYLSINPSEAAHHAEKN
ncbi:hypothetical protein [Polaromonas sp.]|uniref:hypothetical protein n=1 Tax=Polaromonas sp. TaxID=1869339 RepID=UPI003566E786